MGALCKAWLGSLFAIGVALSASAQDRPQDLNAPSAANQRGTLTGKERLGKKWMDEQRIDNCNVPPDKRGTRPRPATCPHVPTG
jgi:hypothetical protein